MITFTRGSGANPNTVEIDFGSEIHYVSPEAPVKGKAGEQTVYVGHFLNLGNSNNYFKMSTLNINGRPSDDAAAVAEWLRDSYFYGIAPTTGGTTPVTDYATEAGQTAMINELQDIEAGIDEHKAETIAIKNKMASAQVNEAHDHKTINWNPDGTVNYVSYKTGGAAGTEVARITLTYDGSGNITEVTKT